MISPLITQPINSASDLLIYELLWTPQAACDRLSYDQLLAAYPDLIQIS